MEHFSHFSHLLHSAKLFSKLNNRNMEYFLMKKFMQTKDTLKPNELPKWIQNDELLCQYCFNYPHTCKIVRKRSKKKRKNKNQVKSPDQSKQLILRCTYCRKDREVLCQKILRRDNSILNFQIDKKGKSSNSVIRSSNVKNNSFPRKPSTKQKYINKKKSALHLLKEIL